MYLYYKPGSVIFGLCFLIMVDVLFSSQEILVIRHVKKNVWIPHFRDNGIKLSVEEGKSIVLYHKFQGILNKLTPRKFAALSDQALQLEISTEESLEECAEMILNNVGEENSVMYDNYLATLYFSGCQWSTTCHGLCQTVQENGFH